MVRVPKVEYVCGFRALWLSTRMMTSYTMSRTASALLAAVLLKSADQGTLLPAG